MSKAQLAVLTCNRCNCQLFTRSDASDEKLRGRLIAEAKPEPAPAAAPVDPDPAPATPPPVVVELDENGKATVPAGTVIADIVPAGMAKKSTWDIWG